MNSKFIGGCKKVNNYWDVSLHRSHCHGKGPLNIDSKPVRSIPVASHTKSHTSTLRAECRGL